LLVSIQARGGGTHGARTPPAIEWAFMTHIESLVSTRDSLVFIFAGEKWAEVEGDVEANPSNWLYVHHVPKVPV
jgi:hypothetical protein